MRVAAEREEIKIVGVFKRLFGKIGLRRRQGALKIGVGFGFALVQLCFNVVRDQPCSMVLWAYLRRRIGLEIFSNSLYYQKTRLPLKMVVHAASRQ